MEDNTIEQQLKEKLKDLFQFESQDLDFGIYRIMNYKRKEIEKFIEQDLIKGIKNELQLVNENEREEIKNKLKEVSSKNGVKKYLQALQKGDEDGAKTLREYFEDSVKEYEELKRQFEQIKISRDLEIQIYNRLINFFSRYYDNGDFISKRRYGKNEKYVVPYNGEEVLLYWANNDQYYIKTTEYFTKYTFKAKGNLIVNFRVVNTEEEKGNVKSTEKKYFVLSEKVFEFDQEDKMDIFFEYRGLTKDEEEKYKKGKSVSQDKINEEIILVLQDKISQNSSAMQIFAPQGEKTLIEKHLLKYTRRNTTDFFIHKNLKAFLEREMDFYIKNEFLDLDDLQVLEQSGYFDKLRLYLIAVRAFRKIAMRIIDFLAQIENFQKKLWEKKKFVIDTHYVITLDKIKEYAGERFIESILDEILNNKKQIVEWKQLFDIEVKNKNDLIENNGKLEFDGKKWKKLPIDTIYFGEDFKWNLLVALSQNNNLDDILDGVLIKSENFQALNLLLNKYKEKVQTIYIDPPYNAKSSEILYKNNYKHSSWLTLMQNRLQLSKNLSKGNSGVHIIAIDFYEQERLGILLDKPFNLSKYEKILVTVIHNPKGRQGENFSITHEYMYIIFPKLKNIISKQKRETTSRNLRDNGGESERHFAKNCFYPIYVKNGIILDFSEVPNENFHPTEKNIYKENGIIEVWPIDKQGIERKWRYSINSVYSIKENLEAKYIDNNWEIFLKKDEFPFKTVWADPKYSATDHGAKIITFLFGNKGSELFSFPKSIYLVKDAIYLSASKDKNSLILDFFAGSGTTAHAVMKLNKEDGGKRKFILVEMADYFYTVIVPRIKKVAYSFNWKEGKPQDTDGIGVFFKYHTLEQYEDALENIEFDYIMGKKASEVFNNYIFYMLDWETKKSNTFLNLEKLQNPFKYKLKIMKNYKQKTVDVDVVETFNYLLGLKVSKYKVIENGDIKYIFVFGGKDGNKICIVWRSVKDIDLKQDKKFVEEQIKDFNPDEIYMNGDSLVNNFKSIEYMFKSLMFEGIEA